MTQVTVSTKYQLVIPLEVRRQIGIRPGARFTMIVKNGLISLKSTMDTPASAVRLRLVVRDLSTGMIGSVDLPILVIKSGG